MPDVHVNSGLAESCSPLQEGKKDSSLKVPHPDEAPSSRTSSKISSTPASPRTSTRKKLVVIGDGAAGKTSLLIAYRDGIFRPEYLPTVFENSTAVVPVESKMVELSLWDTAGQEDYDRLRPLSYLESNVILVCFALDKPQSLENVERKWATELDLYCGEVPRVLVGCKVDLRPALVTATLMDQYVTKQAAERVKERINAVAYIECSSLTGHNVQNVFAQAARVALMAPRKSRRGSSRKTSSASRPHDHLKKSRRCILQ